MVETHGRRRQRVLIVLLSLLVVTGGAVAILAFINSNLQQPQQPQPPITTQPKLAVSIVKPAANEQVQGNGIEVSGTITNAPIDAQLWAASRGRDAGATLQPQDAPCRVDAVKGVWQCPAFYLGGPNDAGKTYDIFVYAVNQAAVDSFLEYDRTKPPDLYPGLSDPPSGAVEAAAVTVVRK